ncbi:zinc transporter ZAT-1 [Cryptosporidium andersoni]|uniref:Zinc transporter ZAT-1 n=1 Tax=Cryptosporidium andersoni TaxID=117008 RepID=A0A1J4MA41_9CRYT|nr:zinc transporter ZAT-1 [Cryptosporidium andersoni]
MTEKQLNSPLLGHKEKNNFRLNNNVQRRVVYAIILCTLFTIIEIIVGIFSHSLALMSDASHLLSDLCCYFITLVSIYMAKQKATKTMSFGYHRAEVLGALLSILLIWIMTILLVYEAIQRIFKPISVDGISMFITAMFGTFTNIFITLVLSIHSHGVPLTNNSCSMDHNHETRHICKFTKNSQVSVSPYITKSTHFFDDDSNSNIDYNKQSISLQSAYTHVIGDILQNIGLMIAGLCIWFKPSWSIVDPLCTILFSFFVLATTLNILKDVATVLMEGTPVGIDCTSIQQDMLNLDTVYEVHDLHVWSLSVGVPALSCHLVVIKEGSARETLRYATELCQKKYGIYHTTIQIDYSANKVACDTLHHKKCFVGYNSLVFSRNENTQNNIAE